MCLSPYVKAMQRLFDSILPCEPCTHLNNINNVFGLKKLVELLLLETNSNYPANFPNMFHLILATSNFPFLHNSVIIVMR